MRTAFLSLLLLTILLFSGCGDMNLFFPLDDGSAGESYLRVSVDEGSIVPAGKSISVDLRESEDSRPLPVKLIANMYDKENRLLDSMIFTDELAGGTIPPIAPEALRRGYHRIRFELFDDGGRLLETRDLDFFYEDKAFSINAITVFPALSIAPSSAGLIFAETAPPDTGYLRWSSGGVVFARGTAADFRDGALWSAPGEPGVYPVLVEYFPEPPPAHFGGDYPFASPVSRSAELYVDAGTGPEPGALGPADAYPFLFHFHGTLDNAGTAGSAEAADAFTVEGSPRPFVHGGAFGYRFLRGDALRIPVAGFSSGTLRVDYRAELADEAGEGELFSIILDEGTILTALLSVGSLPSMLVRVPGTEGSGEAVETVHAVAFEPAEAALSFDGAGSWLIRADGDTLDVAFELDGAELLNRSVGLSRPPSSGGAVLQVGGASSLFLNEFGVLTVN